mgnify:CR=1 FL=1
MFDAVIEMLSYPFMTRAFLVGSLVALCSALLGVSLVLKRRADRFLLVAFGRDAGVETLFVYWGWTFSCGIWCHGDCGCDECRSAYSSNPGCYCSSNSASSNQRECKDQRRCGNCTDFYGSTGDRDYGDFDDDRNEH